MPRPSPLYIMKGDTDLPDVLLEFGPNKDDSNWNQYVEGAYIRRNYTIENNNDDELLLIKKDVMILLNHTIEKRTKINLPLSLTIIRKYFTYYYNQMFQTIRLGNFEWQPIQQHGGETQHILTIRFTVSGLDSRYGDIYISKKSREDKVFKNIFNASFSISANRINIGDNNNDQQCEYDESYIHTKTRMYEFYIYVTTNVEEYKNT